MNNIDIEWYLDVIRRELLELKNNRFTGHVEYKVNYKEGSIANMNNHLHRSIKKPVKS